MRTTSLLALRQSLRHPPRSYAPGRSSLAPWRNITIQASAPDGEPDSNSTSFELVSGHSSHPFASNFSDSSTSSSSTAQSSSSSSDPSSASTGAPEVIPVATNLPQPPSSPPTPLPHLQHPFDTHAFVTYLEKSEVKQATAVVLMESVRDLIIQRKTMALKRMLDKEDMENGAYLFRAALSELRAELSIRAKSDSLSLKEMTDGIRREIDGLEQKMKEDVQTLKHDIEMDMNNRKSETRAEQKLFDLQIEEINNKFTIHLGDLRTEIESAKWESVRRAMSLLVLFIVTGVSASMFYAPDPAAAAAAAQAAVVKPVQPVRPAPVMKDASTSTIDDEDDGGADTEEKLEKLLSDKEIAAHQRRQRRRSRAASAAREAREAAAKHGALHVDRI